MILLIATAGRPESLGSTLRSIASADRPTGFDAIVVVENGAPCGAEAVCREMSDSGEPVRYLHSQQPGKSVALNYALETIQDDALVVMTDDDIRVESQTLMAYDRAARQFPRGGFFGGPFHVDYEVEPTPWIKPYLPLSALGWNPELKNFNPNRDRFLGCNWAAFARDIKMTGGFDPRFGPGSSTGGTGQEADMQKRLHAAGLVSRLVPDACVWHFVPSHRCSSQWTINRARRNGIARGITISSRTGVSKAGNHLLHGLRLAVTSTQTLLTRPEPTSERHFRAAYYRSRSLGYFEGIRHRRAA